jgi:glycosyltransferase involved in cell wall biosynthesis
MKSTPKVSVMVVAYNQAHLIRETLDSILAQGYDNLEIVVADDASTDGTPTIAREYAERYPRKFVLVLNEQHLGITGNCNAAFFACTGDLISTFSGDDLFLPGKICAQVQMFVQDPAVVLCYHPVEIFDSASNRPLYVTFQNPREHIAGAADIITGGGVPGGCAVMVRRSACPPGGFDPRLPTVSDWLFQIEVALNGKVAKVDGVYARYRKHRQGTTQRVFEYLDETLYALDLVLEKHPEHPELVGVCQKGKARYLAGEAFRQLNGNVATAEALARRAVDLDPANLEYRGLWWLTQFQPAARLFGSALNQGKYWIKRYL